VVTVNYSPWSSYCGGGQQSAHYLAEAYAGRGHDVTVIYTRRPGERIEVPQNLAYRIVWARHLPVRTLNAFSVAREVDRLCAAAQVDVVHCQGEEGALLPRVRQARGFLLIATPRYPSYPRQLNAKPGGPVRSLLRWLTPPKYLALGRLLRRADLCCPTSTASARMVQQAYGLDADRFHVVPNGVAPPFLQVERAPSARHGPVVFFGRLDYYAKGLDTLLAAIARLGDEAPELHVVGRGSGLRPAKRQAAALGITHRVRFPGWCTQAELARTLAQARLVVLPSREESFGNAMVEAMAAGAPLITSHAGSIPELVDGGRAAVLLPPDDPAGLAAAMRRLMDDSAAAEHLGRLGREHVRRSYSWAASAKAFEEIFERRRSE